ncbi:MAG: hypothetical protein M0Z35_06860 [Desulfitobacterium hafniense]|nr:hypothetical protein [Desulfitobacterium hafniense]
MTGVTQKLSSLEWDSLIQDYRASGLSAEKWCQEKELEVSKLRWQIRKRQKINKKNQSIQWVPLQADLTGSSPSITVTIGKAEISVSEGFNKQLLAEVVQSLLILC